LTDVYRIAYRIFADDPLNGEGSFLYGGRWSSPGTRMAYTSTTLTLAIVEFLAHVHTDDFDPETPPPLVYVTATLPDGAALTLQHIGIALPPGWDDVPAPAVDAALGDAWVRSARSPALFVPSVHVPLETPERNVLINPLHGDARKIAWRIAPFTYDRRLISARAAAAAASSKR
jgi:RES domain-containing protein